MRAEDIKKPKRTKIQTGLPRKVVTCNHSLLEIWWEEEEYPIGEVQGELVKSLTSFLVALCRPTWLIVAGVFEVPEWVALSHHHLASGLDWVEKGRMLKLDRAGDLSEIALRHSRPSARAGQLLPKAEKELQKRKIFWSAENQRWGWRAKEMPCSSKSPQVGKLREPSTVSWLLRS